MKKLLAIVLAIAMLVSSSGVTIASVVCKRQATTTSNMCTHCRKASSGISLTSKSCCVKINKFLSVKSEFAKPVQHTVVLPHQVLPVIAIICAPIATVPTTFGSHSPTSPPSSLEKCALTSIFRI